MMMRNLFFLLSYLLIVNCSNGQIFKKYPIGASGCSAYFFCDPGNFNLSKSPDSSYVYTGECVNDNVAFGVICVKLNESISDIVTSESMLISYLDFLKGSLNITQSAGYGKGHRLKGREDTRGVIDFWVDKDKANWNVKGWTDGKFITVMYGFSKKELPVTKVNTFLDGLILP
jgi:hypothetical protein